MDRLLIATAEQEEGERYGHQRPESSAKTLGCPVVHHHDLRLSPLIAKRLHRIEVPPSVREINGHEQTSKPAYSSVDRDLAGHLHVLHGAAASIG